MFIKRRSKKKGADPVRASTTLLYESCIIKPRSRPVNRLQNRDYRDKSTTVICHDQPTCARPIFVSACDPGDHAKFP
jgi:hypothetical protein